MSNNRKRSAAVRARKAATGESYTAATFALRFDRETTTTASMAAKPERPDVSHLYGHLVIAKAPRRRTRNGLLLPPAPGSRSTLPRLQAEDQSTADRFDPRGYNVDPVYGAAALTNTHLGRPVYRYGELPGTQLLATKTTLHDEARRTPADPDQPIAYFYSQTGKEHFSLYATVDAIALPELSPKRKAAWDAARTCATCGTTNPSPLPNHITTTERYCTACWPAARTTDFAARQRPIQLQQAEWARDVMADPNVILAGNERTDHQFGKRFVGLNRTRIETFAGEVLLDVLVAVPLYDEIDPANPEERAILESLTPAAERRRAVLDLRDRRLVTFDSRYTYFLDDGENHFPVAKHDHARVRYSCWAGAAESALPTHRPAAVVDLDHPYGFGGHAFTYGAWEKQTAQGRIEMTRACIRAIAGEPPSPTLR